MPAPGSFYYSSYPYFIHFFVLLSSLSQSVVSFKGLIFLHELNTNMAKITVRDTNVTVILLNENDYICLTDIARYKSDDSNAVIGN